MEGRPPFDDSDDLDFDFGADRRRYEERDTTSEREAVSPPPREPDPFDDDLGELVRETEPEPGPGTEPSLTPSGEEFLDPDTAERRAIERRRRERERPSSGALKLPFGRGRKRSPSSDTEERRRLLRDDPYTPADVPVPGERRERRRDLPAKVRRRQAIGLGAIVLVALVGVFLLARAVFGGGDDSQPTPLKKLVGQSFIAPLGGDMPDNKLLKRVRKGQVGGFIVDPRNEQALQDQIAALNQAAEDGDNPPLLFLIDQEGGKVKRLPDGPPDVSPTDLGESGDTEAARSAGEQTGEYLAGLGVNVDLAPVLDVETSRSADTIADRTFGEDPEVVSDLGAQFIGGLQSAKVAATGKHFPGLGDATTNTDDQPVAVVANQEDTDAALVPFQGAIDAGVSLMMVSSASYPTLGSDKPAVFSDQIVTSLLKDQMGFGGTVISDDLQTPAIEGAGLKPGGEAVAAIGAGVDLLLYARSGQGSVQGFNALVKATKEGKFTREQFEDISGRIEALKSDLSSD